MKIYCMSDIHGCITEFEYALSLVLDHLRDDDTILLLLGDYVHGPDSYAVLDKIMKLQREWGGDKVVALMGNHEEMVCDGRWPISETDCDEQNAHRRDVDYYISWMENLPRYYKEGKTIFAHAGIDEEAEDLWEWGTDDYTFTEKYPPQTGKFYEDWKIVAGHVGTAVISGDPGFHDIYYDGESHYYIDGTVLESGIIPILMVDVDRDKYYRVTETGNWIVLPYDEEN